MASDGFSLFDKKASNLINEIRIIGYKCVADNQEAKGEDIDKGQDEADRCTNKTGVSCQVCKVAAFDSVKAQRDHFKLDWHRFNVKQRIMHKPTLSEVDFEETISGELSSISGSDTSDSETDMDDGIENDDLALESTAQIHSQFPMVANEHRKGKEPHERRHPKLFLCNGDNYVFSLYRAIMYSPKNIPDESILIKKLTNLTKESLWMILMTAGGHFAAAVFDGDSVVVHKTFHRYTVRAKRGSAQVVRDSQQGRQPKSAGASLRRYNEAALVQEVHDLLEAWAECLEKCHKIFIRVQTYNKPMLFGGKKPPLDKNDSRIRTIPFSTHRPTFKEVQRVHAELTRVEIIGQESEVLRDVLNQLTNPKPSPTKNQKKASIRDVQINANPTHKNAKLEDPSDSSITDGLCEPLINNARNTTVSNKKSKKKKRNLGAADSNGKEKMSTVIGGPERDVVLPGHHVWNRLYCAVVSGNMKVITELLPNNDIDQGNYNEKPEQTNEHTETEALAEDLTEIKQSRREQADKRINETEQITNGIQDVDIIDGLGHTHRSEGRKCDVIELLNERWGKEGTTLLHVAAKSTESGIIDILMRNGADPSVKDDRGRTPYTNAKSKEARNEFRRFMADNPDSFDYTKSEIPSPLTLEMKEEKERKEAEKKKAQRKARKLRIKRARAAERRFANQQVKMNGDYSVCCAMCSQDLTGRVPFERLEFKYCSTACVRQHRFYLKHMST